MQTRRKSVVWCEADVAFRVNRVNHDDITSKDLKYYRQWMYGFIQISNSLTTWEGKNDIVQE